MNSPRIKLSRLSAAQPAADTNGSPPKVRLRAPVDAGPAAQKPRRGLRSPLAVAGIVLVMIALVGYIGVYAAAGKRTQVLLATRALPAGTVLSAGDLRTGGIAGERSLLATLLPAREVSRVIGQRLATAIPAGAPVPAGALAGRQASESSLTLAVPEFDVIGEGLQPGDRVTVLATYGAGSGTASTRAVARNLQVLAVGEAPANTDASTTTVPVAVALSEPDSASALALAEQDGKIDLLLEGSGSSTAGIPTATQRSAP